MKEFKVLAKEASKREIVMMAAFRVIVATVCTVAGIIGVAYLAKTLGFSKALIITSSVVAGICGFIFSVYWTMTYLVSQVMLLRNK